MIISLGYRVKSRIATHFRRWATERLKEYMLKGFTMSWVCHFRSVNTHAKTLFVFRLMADNAIVWTSIYWDLPSTVSR